MLWNQLYTRAWLVAPNYAGDWPRRPRPRRCPLGCSREGRGNNCPQALLPRGQQRDESLLPSCLRFKVSLFPRGDCLTARCPSSPDSSGASTRGRILVASWFPDSPPGPTTGCKVSPFTSGGHHGCNSGPVSCMARPLVPRVTPAAFIEPAESLNSEL